MTKSFLIAALMVSHACGARLNRGELGMNLTTEAPCKSWCQSDHDGGRNRGRHCAPGNMAHLCGGCSFCPQAPCKSWCQSDYDGGTNRGRHCAPGNMAHLCGGCSFCGGQSATPSPTPSPSSPKDSSCQEQWNNKACSGQFGSEKCHTCGERISWLEKRTDPASARQRVASEFFGQCGKCAPQGDSLAIETEGYSLVWSDEFIAEGMIDTSKWSSVHAGNGFGNNELQFYTNRADNAWVSDGTLKIRARLERFGGRQYTSAKIQTRQDWLYGKFHVRARLLKGTATGTWAANWMMPRENKYGRWPRSGEIDIMEHVGYDTGKVHGTVHTLAYHHSIGTQLGGSKHVDVKEWHTYTVEWRPEVILFACDDTVYQIFRRESHTDKHKWPFDQKFYLILNLAVGGDWGGQRGVDKEAFRGDGQIMEIDWVRVEQRD